MLFELTDLCDLPGNNISNISNICACITGEQVQTIGTPVELSFNTVSAELFRIESLCNQDDPNATHQNVLGMFDVLLRVYLFPCI